MIINHRYKFVFIKTRKVGGTSVEIALSKYCDSNDIITPIIPEETLRQALGYQGAVNYESMGVKNHTPAKVVQEKLSDKVWQNYFKFTILRDPLEVAISDFYWKNKDPDSMDFNVWAVQNENQWNQNWNIHSIDDIGCLDFYILYSRLNSDLTKLSDFLKLPGDLGQDVKHIKAKGKVRNNRVPQISETTRQFIYNVSVKENELINKVENN